VAGVVTAADDQGSTFPNELNSNVEEPKVYIPEVGQDSPFQTISATTPLSSNDAIVDLAQQAADATRRRLLSTDQHTPWQIMHGLLALRENFDIRHEGKVTPAIDWVSTGPEFDNTRWFERTRHGGRAQPYTRPYAFEGHANQFLAILSMSGLPLDHQFQTATGPITMKDMLRHAQMTVNEKDEVTWTLWALSRYLPPDAEWMNENGEPWSIERMVRMQTDKPLKGSPCGGTHGLFALAHARNVYLRQGQPLRGVWLEAEYKIRKHINIARMQQNSNGTLSSNFFRGRSYEQDFNKRMASAGHILEFLMIALPQEELQEQWVRRAIEATCRDLLNNRKAYVKCSPLYHTVNGLSIYLQRAKSMNALGDVAEAKPNTKTAKADVPKPVRSNAAPLKTVPVTSISSTKKVDSDSTPEKSGESEVNVAPKPPVPQTPEARTETEVTAQPQTEAPTPVEASFSPEPQQDSAPASDSDSTNAPQSSETQEQTTYPVTAVSNRLTIKVHPASAGTSVNSDLMIDPVDLQQSAAPSAETTQWKASQKPQQTRSL
jgi:hypothetical protein